MAANPIPEAVRALLAELDEYLRGCPNPEATWPVWMIRKPSRLLWRCRETICTLTATAQQQQQQEQAAPPSAPVGAEAREHANILARQLRWSTTSKRMRAALVAGITALTKQPAAAGEEIMVNAAHDVYTLPLQPSGLSSGPRFVVHVPGPEQPTAPPLAKHQPCGCVICTCEDERQCHGCGAKHCGNRADHPPYVIQQPAAVDGADAQAAEIEALRAEASTAHSAVHYHIAAHTKTIARAERLEEALEDIRSRSAMNLARRTDPVALTAALGNIHRIADAALHPTAAQEGKPCDS